MNHLEELLKAFHISMEDITANRAGHLGPAQQRNLLYHVYFIPSTRSIIAIEPFTS